MPLCTVRSYVNCALLHWTVCRRKFVIIFKIMTEIWDTVHRHTSEAGFALVYRYSGKQRREGGRASFQPLEPEFRLAVSKGAKEQILQIHFSSWRRIEVHSPRNRGVLNWTDIQDGPRRISPPADCICIWLLYKFLYFCYATDRGYFFVAHSV
jgi:hypothetical protein